MEEDVCIDYEFLFDFTASFSNPMRLNGGFSGRTDVPPRARQFLAIHMLGLVLKSAASASGVF
jgi:hypothetical protein